MGRTACTEPHCPHKGALYLYFLLYPLAVAGLSFFLRAAWYLFTWLLQYSIDLHSVFMLQTVFLTLRLLMSYIYGAPILDVSRSHTTPHHSR